MIATTYQNAGEFLAGTQNWLEANETTNSLMLGICLRLRRSPERIKTPPYFITVEDERGLVVVAIMTPPHKIIVYGDRHDPGQALEIIVQDLLTNRWHVPGVFGPSDVAREFADTWTDLAGGNYEEGMHQRIYELKKVIPPRATQGRLRIATKDDVELLTRWISGFQKDVSLSGDLAEAREMAERKVEDRDIYIWEDEKPVSMAARVRPTSNGTSVSLVYTPPEFRQRGYATACVASLSQLLLDSGWKFCSLFTNLSNPASNRVYQNVGYRPVCDFDEYVFSTPSHR